MIKLKNEINKSATMRELRKEAEKGYEHSWQPELQVEAFMKGAEALLNLLHLPRVSNPVCPKCGLTTNYEEWEEFEYEKGGDDPMYGGALVPMKFTRCGECD